MLSAVAPSLLRSVKPPVASSEASPQTVLFLDTPLKKTELSLTSLTDQTPEQLELFLSALTADHSGLDESLQQVLLRAFAEKIFLHANCLLPFIQFLESSRDFCRQPGVQESLAKSIYEGCFGTDANILQRVVAWVDNTAHFSWSNPKAQRYLVASIYADAFGTSAEQRVTLAKNLRAINWCDEKTKVFLAHLISEGKFGTEEGVICELRRSVRLIDWHSSDAMHHLHKAALEGRLGEHGLNVFKPPASDLDDIATELQTAFTEGAIADKKPFRLETTKGIVHVLQSGSEISVLVADKNRSYDFFETKGTSKFIKPNAYLLVFDLQTSTTGAVLSAKSIDRIVTVSRKSPLFSRPVHQALADFKVFIKKDSHGRDVHLYYTPYLGIDLPNILKQGHRFTPEELRELFQYVIGFSKEKEYRVHDFKPSNILYDEDKKKYRVIDYKDFFYTPKYITRDLLPKLHSTHLDDRKRVLFTSIILSFLDLVGIEQGSGGQLVKNEHFDLALARDVVGFLRGFHDGVFAQALLPFSDALRS